jgi:hypothetical protein
MILDDVGGSGFRRIYKLGVLMRNDELGDWKWQ